MAGSNFKAVALVRRLKQQLSLQYAGLVLVDSFDTDDMPILSITSGAELIFVKIMTRDSIRVDGLGLPQRAYSPHKVIVLRDSTISVAAVREIVSAECERLGTEVQVWHKAGLASWADFATATKIVDMFNDPVNPLTNAQ
jgi:hypothetical protein